MSVDWNVVATIASPLLALVVGIWIDRRFEARPKVISYLANTAVLRLNPPEQG
jgi:hypothetical protein